MEQRSYGLSFHNKKLPYIYFFSTCLKNALVISKMMYWCTNVTVHTPLSREVFWHKYAKIPRHTSQNSIAVGNLE